VGKPAGRILGKPGHIDKHITETNFPIGGWGPELD